MPNQLAEGANEQLGNIPFGHLIGGPMVAAVEAQAAAARSSADFIREIGFDEKGDVRNIVFKYKSTDNETPKEVTLNVPLLTILPIPFIRIDNMSINFKAKITAESTLREAKSKSSEKDVSASVSARYWIAKAEMSASYSSKKDSRSTKESKYSVEYTMDITVNAVQDDMPAGMATILNILNDSISNKKKA